LTFKIEPHFRINILPNVGVIERDNRLTVLAEVENNRQETITSVNVVAVAYDAEGTLCWVEDGETFLTLHEGERKAVKIRMDADADKISAVRIYAETEFDEEDPFVTEPTLMEPPSFMDQYFRNAGE
jgi:hypothetical protein